MANPTAVFITFEGIEAAGKSTLIAALNDDLRARGENVLVTREPGGTPLGDHIRQIWRDPASAIDPLAEALLMSADRAQHVATVIAPASRAGTTILCDRYFDATIAYQGFGRGLDIEMLLELSLLATSRVTPDLTLLLDIPPELSLARVRGPRRRGPDGARGRGLPRPRPGRVSRAAKALRPPLRGARRDATPGPTC